MKADGHLFALRARWFVEELRTGKYPNAATLAEHAEIALGTAQRVIDRLRDDHLAPLVYCRERRGYYLKNRDWTLPLLPASQHELMALALARHHLQQASEGLGESIQIYWERLLQNLSKKIPSALLTGELYSVQDSRQTPVQNTILQALLSAILEEKRVFVEYHSKWKNTTSTREISPWHLRNEDGTLYLWAWCHYRNDERIFQVHGIGSIARREEPAKKRPERFYEEILQKGMGRFVSSQPLEAVVRIHPPRARYVAVERWHSAQRDRWIGDVLERSYRIGDIQEAALHLLSLGEAIEVCAPQELRTHVLAQAEAILARHT